MIPIKSGLTVKMKNGNMRESCQRVLKLQKSVMCYCNVPLSTRGRQAPSGPAASSPATRGDQTPSGIAVFPPATGAHQTPSGPAVPPAA